MTPASRSDRFGGRFPHVQEAILEWEEHLPLRENSPTWSGAFTHSVRAAGGTFEEMLPCPNPRCRGGGFEVANLLESMLSERLEAKTGLLVCTGWERTMGNDMEGSTCTKAIRYRIRLSYDGPVGLATRNVE